jgi:type VI secretion system secreted protein VgrG
LPVPHRLSRGRRTGIVLALGIAFASVPAVAPAAAVDLAAAGPFVVLGGSTVTNSGPSVLVGDLGVSPGTSLIGFGSPAVVDGTMHVDDFAAIQAQLALTTAYGVALGHQVPPANDLTGQDLGRLVLTPGA